MTEMDFWRQMISYACGAGKALCEISVNPEGIKIEPEQMRKNVATILTILVETEDFLNAMQANKCSSSD